MQQGEEMQVVEDRLQLLEEQLEKLVLQQGEEDEEVHQLEEGVKQQ